MKQIKNPAYTKWARDLRNYSMDIGYMREIPIDDTCIHYIPFPTNFLTNPRYCNNKQIQQWLALNPAPAKMIDDPEFVALQERINVLEKENNNLKQGIGVDIHKLLLDWHKNHDALSLDDISFIVDKLLLHMRINDLINIAWSVAEEDEHFYTDKGLEVPFIFDGDDVDYKMYMLSVYIDRFKASRNKTREQRYYECLQADIGKKLKDKEVHK